MSMSVSVNERVLVRSNERFEIFIVRFDQLRLSFGGGHVSEEGMFRRRACFGGGHVSEEGMFRKQNIP